MSDDEFLRAKRICERHGFRVKRIGGVEVGDLIVNPAHIASLQVTGSVIRLNWVGRTDEVFDLKKNEVAERAAEAIRSGWN